MTTDYPPEARDFDFIHGRWTVANRKLKTRGTEAEDWDVSASAACCEPCLNGLVNVEQIDCPAAIDRLSADQGLGSAKQILRLRPTPRSRFRP